MGERVTDVVLIHGAGGTRDEMRAYAAALGPELRCWVMDLLGHGGRPIPDDYGVPLIAEDLLRGLDAAQVGKAFYFGYSLGGYVGLYLSRHFPERVAGCIALSTKYIYNQTHVEFGLHVLDPVRQARLGIEQEPWQDALDEVHRRLLANVVETGPPLSEDDMRAISRPVLLLNADRDRVVGVDETRRLAQLIPTSRVAIFEGVAHPLAEVPLEPTLDQVRRFIDDVHALGL